MKKTDLQEYKLELEKQMADDDKYILNYKNANVPIKEEFDTLKRLKMNYKNSLEDIYKHINNETLPKHIEGEFEKQTYRLAEQYRKFNSLSMTFDIGFFKNSQEYIHDVVVISNIKTFVDKGDHLLCQVVM